MCLSLPARVREPGDVQTEGPFSSDADLWHLLNRRWVVISNLIFIIEAEPSANSRH